MAEIREFDIIRALFAPLSGDGRESLHLSDDAALLDVPEGRRLVVTTDTLVEGVHFPVDERPDLIARKALRVNLSDVAAMGARPKAVLLNLGIKRGAERDWVERFAFGLADDLSAFAVPLIGGDTVACPGATMVTVTAFGSVAPGRALLRSGARPGDLVCVSGTLGDAAAGLKVAIGEIGGEEAAAMGGLVERYRIPQPRLTLANALAEAPPGVIGACMDVSDGLLQDLGHICRASGCGAVVRRDALPLSADLRRCLERRPEWRDMPLNGGDDYELLFTVAPSAGRSFIDGLAARSGIPLTVIGEIAPKNADLRGVSLIDERGNVEEIIGGGGYQHEF